MKLDNRRGRILLVDDDVSIRTMLRLQLNRMGYDVVGVPGVASARELLKLSSYLAVVLDIELEDGTAYDLLRSDLLKQAIVIIITVREAVDEKVEAFALGADDYMVKPVDSRELVARIDRLCQRGLVHKSEEESIHTITIDEHRSLNLIERTIYGAGTYSLLSKAEFNLLRLMLADRKAAVSRERISREVVGRAMIEGSRAVDILVGQTRQKLAVAGPHNFMRSIRGVGYRFDPNNT